MNHEMDIKWMNAWSDVKKMQNVQINQTIQKPDSIFGYHTVTKTTARDLEKRHLEKRCSLRSGISGDL